MLLMAAKAKVTLHSYSCDMLDHASRIRGRPRMPSESNFDHAAVSQEGGCQLNHLYGDVTHPWGVPTCHKTNLVAYYVQNARD